MLVEYVLLLCHLVLVEEEDPNAVDGGDNCDEKVALVDG